MTRIRPLPSAVVNKIAAGEVIERPASVVKELLENSLDASAMRIDVDVGRGGTEWIRVVDDGEGMSADDLPWAVASHATSKITSDADLFRVHTMGFRGEALASIAAVSRMRIRSRRSEESIGHELEVIAGEASPVRECGCPVGTTMELRELFHNTPVRRKFLRTVATEFGHISEQFTRIAIAHPRLHLTLRHNEKTVYELPATTRLRDRLRVFYGEELADQLIAVESESDGVRLWGYVAHPNFNKPSRKGQFLFLNGRSIQDRSLQHALGEAYRGILMVGRYPIAFLFLEMPPDMVDVNVHPTKAEVRFREGQNLYRQLLSTLRNTFLGMDLDGVLNVPQPVQRPPVDSTRQLQLAEEFRSWATAELAQSSSEKGDLSVDVRQSNSAVDEAASSEFDSRVVSEFASQTPGHSDEELSEAEDFKPAPSSGESASSRVMQVHDCYLVTETDEGLTVIDQHALHERVLYERLKERVLSSRVESQKLLVPLTIEMPAADVSRLLEHRDLLEELGFGVDEFGGNTLALTAYPAMLAKADHVELLRDLAEQLGERPAEEGQTPTRRDILDRLLHTMACRSAIKAGQRLTSEEMESLLTFRHLIDDAHHCPHGRPTALVVSREQLDRQFGRLGS